MRPSLSYVSPTLATVAKVVPVAMVDEAVQEALPHRALEVAQACNTCHHDAYDDRMHCHAVDVYVYDGNSCPYRISCRGQMRRLY